MKRFQRLFCLLLTFATAISMFAACTPNAGTESSATESHTVPPSVTGEVTTTDQVTTGSEATEPPSAETEPPAGGQEQTTPPALTYPWAQAPKTLKVLAIGNSFSDDAMEYLYQIAKSAGVETVILGNIRYSSCTLDKHYEFASADLANYTYRKNTNGDWVSTGEYKFSQAIADEAWDYITLQQGSHHSGLSNKYTRLDDMVKIICEKRTNPQAKLLWHMTWAYQQNTSNSNFSLYSNNQMTMYNAIVNTTKNVVLPSGSFVGVIPSGTAVQNARTGFMGDNICRDDGYHMSQPYGRYLVGLCYFAAITGVDISNIAYSPSTAITADMIALAKESVKNAMLNPYAVTKSAFEASHQKPEDSADSFAADQALASGIGVDLSKYTLLEYEYVENAYYNSTSRITYVAAAADQQGKFICFKNRYTKEQLLNAVIICDAGWQYRPEVWVNEIDKAAKRAGNKTTQIVLLNDAWWGDNTILALNISKTSGTISDNYAEAALHLRVYIPAQ